MNTRARPLILAAALALGVCAPAFGQAGGDSGGNTNSLTAPARAAPVDPAAPVTDATGAPVYRGSATNDMYGPAVVTPAPAPEVGRIDDDAHERAARAARATPEEEHGGLRNWWHDKKDRARAKAGMAPDNEHDDD